MAQKFRTRKENGEVIRYPVRGRGNAIKGVSKKTANFYANQIRESYPDINPRVLQVGNKKDNLYSPFVPYLVDQVMKALPIGSSSNLLNALPPVTYKTISGVIGSHTAEPVYVLFYGSNGGGSAVFGRNRGLDWMIDWPGMYPDGAEDRVLVKSGDRIEERNSNKEINEARESVKNFFNQIRHDETAKDQTVILSESEAEKLYDSLLSLDNNAFVEISVQNGVVNSFPVNQDGKSFTFASSSQAYPEGKRGYYPVDAIKSVMRGFLNAGMPLMTLHYLNYAENPLLFEFPISQKRQGGFQQAFSSDNELGHAIFSAVVSPYYEQIPSGV